MSPFWRGFTEVFTSRFHTDAWLVASGFGIGIAVERGNYAFAVVYLICAVLFAGIGYLNERERRSAAFKAGFHEGVREL